MSTDRYDWRIKKGLNVICLCMYAEIEDWPTTYSRVSINPLVFSSTLKCVFFVNIDLH